jgi:hypothetical protein
MSPHDNLNMEATQACGVVLELLDAPTPTTMTAEEAALRLDAAIPEWRKACDYDDERSVGPLLSIFWDLCIKIYCNARRSILAPARAACEADKGAICAYQRSDSCEYRLLSCMHS